MRILAPTVLVLMALVFSAAAFQSQVPEPFDTRMPNGKLQRDVIRDDDFKKNVEDLAEIVRLAEDVKIEMEKTKGMVLNLESLKKLKEIEKRSEQVRNRMKRR